MGLVSRHAGVALTKPMIVFSGWARGPLVAVVRRDLAPGCGSVVVDGGGASPQPSSASSCVVSGRTGCSLTCVRVRPRGHVPGEPTPRQEGRRTCPSSSCCATARPSGRAGAAHEPVRPAAHARGEEQARAVASALARFDFALVLTSPRQRAARTAQLAGLAAEPRATARRVGLRGVRGAAHRRHCGRARRLEPVGGRRARRGDRGRGGRPPRPGPGPRAAGARRRPGCLPRRPRAFAARARRPVAGPGADGGAVLPARDGHGVRASASSTAGRSCSPGTSPSSRSAPGPDSRAAPAHRAGAAREGLSGQATRP